MKVRKSASSLEIGVFLEPKKKGKKIQEPLFEVERGEEGPLQGVSRGGDLYLFGLHVASGEDEEALRLLEELKSPLSSQEISDKEFLKSTHALSFLCSLLEALLEADHTRSGIAKQLFLAELVDVELSRLQKKRTLPDLQSKRSQLLKAAKMKHQTLHVERYLPKDSLWLFECKKLQSKRISKKS